MEPLWSPAVATSGNRWQMPRPRKPQKQAKPVGPGCHQLPANFMVRRGSTVRVRQRASTKCLQIWISRRLLEQRTGTSRVHLWYWRRTATSCGILRHGLLTGTDGLIRERPCKRAITLASLSEIVTPPRREGVSAVALSRTVGLSRRRSRVRVPSQRNRHARSRLE
jgi:hypothetical protein